MHCDFFYDIVKLSKGGVKVDERIREIREYFNLNQREFSKRIDVGQSTLAMFETGDRVPRDIHINRICREFNVREEWLRNGTGYMSVTLSQDDRFSINLSKLGRSENEFIVNAVNILAETEPEKLEIVEQLMKKLLGI